MNRYENEKSKKQSGLTEPVTQPIAVQRSPQPGAGVPSSVLAAPDATGYGDLQSSYGNAAVAQSLTQPEGEGQSTAVAAVGLIVENTAETLEPGQMRKSEFLAQLRASVCSATAEALADTPWSEAGCPYIDRWFGHYGAQSSDYIERAIRRYAPEAAGATAASGYIPAITARVRQAVSTWATTGEITGVPGGVPLGSLGGGLMGAVGGAVSGAVSGVTSAASSVASGVAGAASSMASGIGSALSAAGDIFFKEREGGATVAGDPQAIQAQLGAGQSLDGGVKSQMESAFGESFSGVQVHTDANAAGISDNLNARAFTVGEHVAFGAGEYQPGTMIGDALIAHELAHVVQQRGGGASVESKQNESAGYGALEENADRAAVGAVVSTWGGARKGLANVARNAMPSLKSGLRLQRCSNDKKPEEAFFPLSAVEQEALARMRQDIAVAEEMLRDTSLSEEDQASIKQAINNARGALGGYVDVREQGQTRAYIMAPIATASGVIVADDATVVGVADDWLLIVTGLAAIVTYIATNPPPARDAISDAWLNVGSKIDILGKTIGTVLMAQKVGDQIRGQSEVLAVHLARLLGETVGGRPPDEPNDPWNFKHWWKEIKAALKNIKDKGLSTKQLMRELQKKFTPEQIESIKNALRKAAEKMGEEPPEFL